MKPSSLENSKINNFNLIERVGHDKYGNSLWKCKCELCGQIVQKSLVEIKSNKSCGCLRHKKKYDINSRTDESRLYKIYSNMKSRCYNKNCDCYSEYGRRNIRICDEWINDFQSFYKWSMDNGYNDKLSIDRIDVNGNYEPNNCRWITLQEQQSNKRNNVFIEYKGEKKTISEWAKEVGVQFSTMKYRIKKGWPLDKAMSKEKYTHIENR